MKSDRFRPLVFAVAATVFVLLAALPWPWVAAPGSTLAAQRPTVPPAPTAGRPRPTLPPAPCGDNGSGRRCKDEQPEPDICLRLSGSSETTSRITYIVAAQNDGRGDTGTLDVTLSFDAALAPGEVTFSAPGGWVSSIVSDAIELRFGRLAAGEIATATVRLNAPSAASAGSTLVARARLHQASRQPAGRSNRVSLVRGQPGVAQPTLLRFDPAEGVAGTTFRASDDGFASQEQVSIWYHRPDGSTQALASQWADEQGGLALQVASAQLPPGRYLVVAQGQCSRAPAVGTVVIIE